MKQLIELFGIDLSYEVYNNLKEEIPNMDESYYVRNVIRTIKN